MTKQILNIAKRHMPLNSKKKIEAFFSDLLMAHTNPKLLDLDELSNLVGDDRFRPFLNGGIAWMKRNYGKRIILPAPTLPQKEKRHGRSPFISVPMGGRNKTY